jgi:teichoic acid transport system permease protein
MKKYFPYAVRSAKADLKSDVANSYLNWLWWILEPLCMMLIYAVIFGVVFNASEKYFPVFIFIGITMWGFFSKSVMVSVSVVRMNKAIISRVYMPKYILLLSKMFVNAFKMMISFIIIAIMMVFYHMRITWNIIYVLPLLIVLFLFTFGIGTILMHYGVFISDLSNAISILLSMLMYFTGIFYSISKRIPAPFGKVLENYNPLAYLISGMRNVLIYGRPISRRLLVAWGIVSIIIIAIGVSNIYRNENSYVKVI